MSAKAGIRDDIGGADEIGLGTKPVTAVHHPWSAQSGANFRTLHSQSFPLRGLILFLALIPFFVQAQEATILILPVEETRPQVDYSETRGLCFRGHPLPECRSFLLTEAQAGYRFAKNGFGGDLHGFVLGGDVGWIRNLDERNAVGGAIGANNLYVSAGPRYRRWLTEEAALDIGLSAAWEPGRIEIVELHVAMMYGDRIGLWVSATHDFGRGDPGLAIGIQTGSEPGLIVYGLGAAFAGHYLVKAISVSD